MKKSCLQLYRRLIVLHFSSPSSLLHHFHPSPSAFQGLLPEQWPSKWKLMLTRLELYVCSPTLSSFPFESIYFQFCVFLWENIALKENKRHGCACNTAQCFILTLNFPWPPQQSFKSRPSLKSQFTHSGWNTGKVLFQLLKDKGQFKNKNQCPWNKEGSDGVTVQPWLKAHYCLRNYGFVALIHSKFQWSRTSKYKNMTIIIWLLIISIIMKRENRIKCTLHNGSARGSVPGSKS